MSAVPSNALPSNSAPDPLVPAAPTEKSRGCVGCLVGLAWLFVTPAVLAGLPISSTSSPGLTMLGVLVVAGFLFFWPTAARRGWIRRWQLRRIIKRRPLPGGAVEGGALRLPLDVFGAGPRRAADDSGFDRPARTLDGQRVLDLLDARSALDDDRGDGLRRHPHPAMRLAWVSRRRAAPTEALVELAGDGWGMTRAVAWNRLVRSLPDDPDALTAAARRVADAENDPTRHPISDLLAQRIPDTRGDPLPAALDHLGQHGEAQDVRRIARWMPHPDHGRPARQARAAMHVRLGDRLESGHLSLPAQAGGGELSPAAGGELSAPADAPTTPVDEG